MKILAGIVLYNPEIIRLKKNIEAIEKQVNKIILIDNNSDNIDEIKKYINEKSNIEIIYNKTNLGIAVALNQILDYANNNMFEWYLTLDQDSVVKADLIEEYLKYVDIDENIAIVTSEYEDLNVDLKQTNFKGGSYIFVNDCITSGSLNNTKKIIEKCKYDEKMFIDLVDYDFCATIKEHGFKILKINYKGFFHEVGKSRKVKILWRDEIIFNHSPLRIYYIVRNSFYFIKKHKKSINIFKWYLKTWKKIFLILMFENEKKEKFSYVLKGIKDYKKI